MNALLRLVCSGERFAIGVTLEKLQNQLVLNPLRIQFDVIGAFFCNRVDFEIAQKLWNVQLALSNILASIHEVVAKREMNTL